MSLRKRLLIFLAALLVLGGLSALLSPFAVAHGLRAWLSWAARHKGMQVEIGKIDAPFLHPVTIDGLKVRPAPEKGRAVWLEAARATVDFDFRGWLFSKHARFVHAVTVEHLRGSIGQRKQRGAEKLDWKNLARLLPDEFHFTDVDLEVTTVATKFAFRGVNLNASEIEAGQFFAREIFVTSPILRQTFRDLRGATSWESDRLTVAGVSLVRGLDLEALTIDLASLTNRRVGLDSQLDAFGGVLRASFQGHGEGTKFAIDLAGSATNVSLAQISSAAGFLEPVTGSVRASKFTFRGNPGEFLDATASIWIEVSDFAWRSRRGDHLVFGATYYDRRLQVEQLYVQQEQNELTVNGELLWPKKRPSWTALPFRGQVTAAIPDADSFAQLFGAAAGDFSGALSVRGDVNLFDPSAHGQLAFKGEGVRFRGVSLDSLGGTIALAGAEATLGNLEIRHANDFLRGHGNFNLQAPHHYAARFTGAIDNLGDYAPLLPSSWSAGRIGGGVTFDWSGDGTPSAHSGTMQLFAHGLQLPVAPLRAPLDVTLEGTYSPQDVFFRTFRLADDRASLGGFLMLGSNFVELQALELTLDGVLRAQGTLFLPWSVAAWHRTGRFLEALDERQKFDVDLAVDQLDLGQFAKALSEQFSASGSLSGKLAAYGSLAALQVTTNWRLQNLGGSASPNELNLDLRYQNGRADADLRATFGVSSPVTAEGSVPLRLEKRRLADGSWVNRTAPFWLRVDCPALFPAMMPAKWRPLGASSGIVYGQINYANTIAEPKIDGTAQLLDAKIAAPPLSELAASIRFADHAATIESWRCRAQGEALAGSGRLTISLPRFALTLWPSAPARLEKITLRGALDGADLRLAINDRPASLAPDALFLQVVAPPPVAPDFGLSLSAKENPWP